VGRLESGQEIGSDRFRGNGRRLGDWARGCVQTNGRDSRRIGQGAIHPFGDPAVVASQGTAGFELTREAADLDAMVVPVGGGGLVCGIAASLRRDNKGPRIIGVESRGATALATGVEAGKPVTIEPSSVADGLLAPFTTQLCIDLVASHEIELIDVGEPEIKDAMRGIYTRGKLGV